MSAHVSKNSGEMEWYTPGGIVESARIVMGGIDLDPASSGIAQRIVQAGHYFTAEDNGLTQDWFGKVWMNPPYARDLIGNFISKLKYSPKVTMACVLVNNATETQWGQDLLSIGRVVCFPFKRVRFLSPEGEKGAPLQGQMIVGTGNIDVEIFREEFGDLGVCYGIFP